MSKRKKPEPTAVVKTVELTQQERHFLVGILTQAQEEAVTSGHREAAWFISDLSDKIMSEKEAAAFLQSMGFDIVDKEGRTVSPEELGNKP